MTAAEHSLIRNMGNKRRNQSAFPRLEILIIVINPVKNTPVFCCRGTSFLLNPLHLVHAFVFSKVFHLLRVLLFKIYARFPLAVLFYLHIPAISPIVLLKSYPYRIFPVSLKLPQ